MLIEFYGEECPHCITMAPLVEQLEKEEGVKIEKYEMWHHAKNAKEFAKYDQGRCGGVPFFINTESGEFICGATSYENLKRWSGAGKHK